MLKVAHMGWIHFLADFSDVYFGDNKQTSERNVVKSSFKITKLQIYYTVEK